MKKLAFGLISVALLAGGCSSSGSVAGVKLVGDRITFDDHINFATGEATILEDSYPLLDKIAFLLKANDDIATVHVHGHTDTTGEPDFNQSLSEKRAAAVEAYLRDVGVKQTLMSKGFGQGKVLCEEKTDDCNAMNRRVEFYIERN